MQAGQQNRQDAASPANGHAALQDLFALTDEQILEIEPEAQAASTQDSAAAGQPKSKSDSAVTSLPRNDGSPAGSPDAAATSHESPVTSHDSPEPPPWLAAQMKDPWSGEEARELWNGVQQARQEAAAYRAAFATPEDARALKELYPGGVNEARSAAERARVLDDIDSAFFGAAGKSAQDVSASRAQLAQRMLREDPAAFREMVFAGLRALEQSGAQTGRDVGSRFSATTAAAESGALQTQGGPKFAPANSPAQAQAETQAANHDARLAAYVSFEKAANEDLERSVGGAIERTLNQALPIVGRSPQDASSRAGQAPPLQARLSAAIRQDVEAALKGDRQLSEQVAQILSGRRLDEETRGQVVRLIGERAQQLVPVAAKRVLNDWTQTAFAAHRSRNQKTETTAARKDVSVANVGPSGGSSHTSLPKSVDYRKLSDEQILEL